MAYSYVPVLSSTHKRGSRNEGQHLKHSHTIIGGRNPNVNEANHGRSEATSRQLADKSLLEHPHFAACLAIQHQRAESNTPSEAFQKLERMRGQHSMSHRSRSHTVDIPPGRYQGMDPMLAAHLAKCKNKYEENQ